MKTTAGKRNLISNAPSLRARTPDKTNADEEEPARKKEGQVNLSTASTVVEEVNGAGFLLPSRTTLSSTEWVLDSGADCHISNDHSLFTSLNTNIRGSVGSWMKGNNGTVQGKGTVALTFATSVGPRQTVLQNVLYAPNSTVNLISLS